jgi:hypothetical protein
MAMTASIDSRFLRLDILHQYGLAPLRTFSLTLFLVLIQLPIRPGGDVTFACNTAQSFKAAQYLGPSAVRRTWRTRSSSMTPSAFDSGSSLRMLAASAMAWAREISPLSCNSKKLLHIPKLDPTAYLAVRKIAGIRVRESRIV